MIEWLHIYIIFIGLVEVVIFEALSGCHVIQILGKNVIKCRQRPAMTLAVNWDVKHQNKQTNKNFPIHVIT